MNYAKIEAWQHNRDVEVFYSASLRTLIFKKHHFLYWKGVDDLVSYPYINLGSFGSRYSSASLSGDQSVLTF